MTAIKEVRLRKRNVQGNYEPFRLSTLKVVAPNKPEEFLGVPCYSFLLQAAVPRGGRYGPGILTFTEWYEVIRRHLEGLWSQADRDKLPPQGKKNPLLSRWNYLQAYSILRSIDRGSLFFRSRNFGEGKKTVSRGFLVGATAPDCWVLWASDEPQQGTKLLGITDTPGQVVYQTGFEFSED